MAKTDAGPKSLAKSLLSSGLFLEREALQEFRSSGFDAWGPYEFPMKSDAGDETAFGSVDIMASIRKDFGEVEAEVIVFAECKYKHPEGRPRLYFLEAEPQLDKLSRASVLQLSRNGADSKLKRSGMLPPTAPVLGPGTLAYQQDNGIWTTDGNVLSHATAQAIRPVVTHCITDAFTWMEPVEPRIRLYLPAVCTSAEIWSVPSTTTRTQLEATVTEEGVNQLAVRRDVGQLVYHPPQYLRETANRLLKAAGNVLVDQNHSQESVGKFKSNIRAGLALTQPKRIYVGKPDYVASLARRDVDKWFSTIAPILAT